MRERTKCYVQALYLSAGFGDFGDYRDGFGGRGGRSDGVFLWGGSKDLMRRRM